MNKIYWCSLPSHLISTVALAVTSWCPIQIGNRLNGFLRFHLITG
jgi:hypothetical protein